MCPPPGGRSSPPGHPVVDGWRRDERPRDTPQSLLRALVSSAKPTTGVQVERPAAPPMPRLAPSGCPQSRATPPQTTQVRFCPTPAMLRQGEMTPTPTPLRQLTFDLLALSPRPERPGDDLSCDSYSR